MKLALSLSVIAIVLLISSIISVLEFSSMSSYVSDLIADNLRNMNTARQLAEASNTYNLDILAVVGDEFSNQTPDFDQEAFMSRCDSLKKSLKSAEARPLADSVIYSYSAYMLTSLELENVLASDFIDSRSWYFERLQPKFNRLRSDIDKLSNTIVDDLSKNSERFDRGFYRSIIPGIVAVGVGLLLLVLLFFYLMAYYVNPIYKMLKGMNEYRSNNRKYNYTYDGDDQLSELNDGITELTGENQQLRKRVNDMRNKLNQ